MEKRGRLARLLQQVKSRAGASDHIVRTMNLQADLGIACKVPEANLRKPERGNESIPDGQSVA
jgi:hypothetical protein